MDINVDVNIDEVVRLTQKVLQKLPYVINTSITDTAKLAVAGVRLELQRDFKSRKNFLAKRFKILQYSRTSTLTAIVGVDPKVEGSPLLLGFFEEGGTKTPDHGPELAIAITGEAARPSFADQIPRAMLYKNLQLSLQVGGSTAIFPGLRGTYLVPGVGVFQRDGGKSELIYTFKSSAPLTQRTHLRDLVKTIVGESFSRIFTRNFIKEIGGK